MGYTYVNDIEFTSGKFIDKYEPTTPRVFPPGEDVEIMYLHGGAFSSEDEESLDAQLFCQYMADNGFRSWSLRYTFDGSIGDAANDIQTAVLWNQKRVVLCGYSTGASACLHFAVTDTGSTWVKGVISIAGALYSTLSSLSQSSPPIMLWHGKQDTIVPYSYAEAILTRNTELQRVTTLYGFDSDHTNILNTTTPDGKTLFQKSLEFVNHVLSLPSQQTQLQSYFPSPGGKYFFVMQDDGNMCLYAGSGPSDNHGFQFGTIQMLSAITRLSEASASSSTQTAETPLDYELAESSWGSLVESMNFVASDYSYFSPTRHAFTPSGEYLFTTTLNGTIQVHYTHRHSGIGDDTAHEDESGTYSWHMHFQGQPAAYAFADLHVDYSTEENGLTGICFGAFFNEDWDDTSDISKEVFMAVCKRDTSGSQKYNEIFRGKVYKDGNNVYIDNVNRIYRVPGTGGNAAHQIQEIVPVIINNQSHILCTVGDSAINGAAEDESTQHGKILLMQNNGTPPAFMGSRPFSDPYIQVKGIRNVYGLKKLPIWLDTHERFVGVENGNGLDRLTFGKLIDFSHSGGGQKQDLGWRMSIGDTGSWLITPDKNLNDLNMSIHHSDGAPTCVEIFTGREDIFKTHSNSEWKIVSPTGQVDVPIYHGDTVYIHHKNTNAYLTITDRSSPIISSQKEVTLTTEQTSVIEFFVEIDGGSSGQVWTIDKKVRFIHKDSNKALHGGYYYGDGKREVTGFSYRDAYDLFQWYAWGHDSEGYYDTNETQVLLDSVVKLNHVGHSVLLYSEPGDTLPAVSQWGNESSQTQRVMMYNHQSHNTPIIRPIPFRVISGVVSFFGNTGDNGPAGLWDKTIKVFTIQIEDDMQPTISWMTLIKRRASGKPGSPVGLAVEPKSGILFFSDVYDGQAWWVNMTDGTDIGWDNTAY